MKPETLTLIRKAEKGKAMTVQRLKNYAPGTAAKIGTLTITKWGDHWWAAFDGKTRVWAATALRAYRAINEA